jgi:spermidine synthase
VPVGVAVDGLTRRQRVLGAGAYVLLVGELRVTAAGAEHETGPVAMRRPLELAVFVVGASSLGAEVTAARLLAPWFGASTIVWANTIAVVLVALSVGYSLGGRVADRYPRPEALAWVMLPAAALLAAVPFASEPFLPLAVKAVDQLNVATFLGSLLGCGVLLALPLFLIGMVSPYAVRLRLEHVEDAGRTAGRLYALSTIGALVGTFSASLFLIPVVGTRRTFLVFAVATSLSALPLLDRGRLPASVVPATIVALIAVPTGTIKSADADGGRVIWERETEYQYARVVQDPDGTRYLELNEGHAVHSAYVPGKWLTDDYWDDMLALSLAGGRPPRSVAILGSAAGTTARQLGHYFPQARVDAVELDGDLTAVGRKLFDLEGPNLHTYTADARPWLYATHRTYDVIMVDAYRQPYIPFYLTTEQFFALARKHLNPGGVLVVNAAHPQGSEALEKVLTATMASQFGASHVWRDPGQPTNTVLEASLGPPPAPGLRATLPALPPDLRQVVEATAARMQPGLTGGRVYTDDLAPVEWLVDLSLADAS